jgi:hypothetical protein
MTEFANTQTVALFVNATTRQIQCDGLTKSISDDYWTKEISPVLYPLWDSDRDKLESFIFYKDETSKMLKNKYQRDQKTKAYKWVSYEFDTSEFTALEIKGLYNTLHDKFVNYRDIEDYDLDAKLRSIYAKDNMVNWNKLKMMRKFLLMDCDWTQAPDSPLTDEVKAQWVAYRQKLRDIPSDQKGVPAVEVEFPITPSKYATRVADGDTEEYLADTKHHYFYLNQAVLKKYTDRILTYLSISIAVDNIDALPVSRIFDSNTETNLDSILEQIAAGE